MGTTRIIISGGGTGGHIYPAIAIAHALRELRPAVELLFVGAEGKMEMEKVPRAGFSIVGLPITGLNRSDWLANLQFPAKLINSLWRARTLLLNFRPDAAVGVGGYASGPLLLVAGMRRVPYLIQEQNSYAGITNKFLGRAAQTICVAYPGMETFFPKEKIRLTGNPVRKDLLDIADKQAAARRHFGLDLSRKTLLVIGGSQGARTINESIDAGLASLTEAGYQVVWQTGKSYLETARQTAALGAAGVYVSDFIYEMDLAYAAADVVVSRAGALSVSELCLAEKPAIFVPFPAAAADHQTKNAQTLVNAGAGILIADADARRELVPAALALLTDPVRQQRLSQQIRQLARPDAAREIAQEVLQLADSRP